MNQKKHTHCQLYLREPVFDKSCPTDDPADPYAYISDDERVKGMSFQKYVCSIDQYPNEYFDVVLIDGRARPSCIYRGINKVSNGGLLILDNADCAYYSKGMNLLKNKRWKENIF
ncbi:hypothetical protein QUF75_01430 [Desulfococcaceae bacterium HSG7]|nr:hypothetical protein [Desulfococcaceae bacterium HSG7]